MAKKFGNLRDAYKYFDENKGGGDISFFSLKDDRETTVVRFLHEGDEDLDWYIVHEVEIQGKKRKVLCNERGDCPLCVSGSRPQLKIFLQLIDQREPDKIKIWERGQRFIPKVLSFIQRYGTMCGQPVEVERLGKRGDTSTDYQLYPLEKDNKTLEDLGKQREELASENGFILVKSHDVMQQIAMGTYVPDTNNNNNNDNFGGNNNGNGAFGGNNNSDVFGGGNQNQEIKPRQTKSGSDIF